MNDENDLIKPQQEVELFWPNLETCLLCLIGFAPGAIYWSQSALPGIRPVSVLRPQFFEGYFVTIS